MFGISFLFKRDYGREILSMGFSYLAPFCNKIDADMFQLLVKIHEHLNYKRLFRLCTKRLSSLDLSLFKLYVYVIYDLSSFKHCLIQLHGTVNGPTSFDKSILVSRMYSSNRGYWCSGR